MQINQRNQDEILVPLSEIRVSHNPRKSHRGLLDLFHEQVTASDATVKSRKAFIAHIDDNFPHIRDRATSIRNVGQILPVTLRPFRSGGTGSTKYGIASGECRILALGLIEAESGDPQRVRAISKQMTVDQAFEQGVDENTQRKDMDALDLSAAYNEMLTERINPATRPGGSKYRASKPNGRPYTLKELAERVNKDYHWVRGRAALVYLPESHQEGLRDGNRNLTAMCKLACKHKADATGKAEDRKAVDESSVKDVEKKPRRRRVVAMPKLVELFDATPTTNTERLQALADCMGIVSRSGNPVTPVKALEIALAEREDREAEKEIAAGRKVVTAA
jgi:hypothetical protein